jgi:hypothetical protein
VTTTPNRPAPTASPRDTFLTSAEVFLRYRWGGRADLEWLDPAVYDAKSPSCWTNRVLPRRSPAARRHRLTTPSVLAIGR